MLFFLKLFKKSELDKVKKAKKDSRIICDFLNFMKANGLMFYTSAILEGETESKLIKIEGTKEEIDRWLIEFFKIDLDKLEKESDKLYDTKNSSQ